MDNNKRKKKVYVYGKNLKLLSVFDSTLQASKKMGISQGNIVLTCQGVLPHYHGMYMSYEPLSSMEDVEELHKQGEEKRARRDAQVKNAQTKFFAENKERLVLQASQWYLRNKEKVLEYQHERYIKRRDERKLQNNGKTKS